MFEENVVSSAGTTYCIDAAEIERRIRTSGFRAVRRNVKYEWLTTPRDNLPRGAPCASSTPTGSFSEIAPPLRGRRRRRRRRRNDRARGRRSARPREHGLPIAARLASCPASSTRTPTSSSPRSAGASPVGDGFLPWVERPHRRARRALARRRGVARSATPSGAPRVAARSRSARSRTRSPRCTRSPKRRLQDASFTRSSARPRAPPRARARASRPSSTSASRTGRRPISSYAPAPHTLYTLHLDVARMILEEAARADGARACTCSSTRSSAARSSAAKVPWSSGSRAHPHRPDVARRGRRARSIDVADDLGALAPDVLLVHLTDARPDELARVAKAEAPVVLCPRSNLHIEGKLPPLLAVREAGIEPGARHRLARVERVARRPRRGQGAPRSLPERPRVGAREDGHATTARAPSVSRATASSREGLAAWSRRGRRRSRRTTRARGFSKTSKRRGGVLVVDRRSSQLRRPRRLLAHDLLAPVRGERGRPRARRPARAAHDRARRGDARLHGRRAHERHGVQPLGGPRHRREEPAHQDAPRPVGRGARRRGARPRARSGAVFLALAATLGFWPAVLSPFVLAVLLGYSLRQALHVGARTRGSASRARSRPAARGSRAAPSPNAGIVALMAAVVTWLLGFDVLYSLQDASFDRDNGLHSMPARFGVRRRARHQRGRARGHRGVPRRDRRPPPPRRALLRGRRRRHRPPRLRARPRRQGRSPPHRQGLLRRERVRQRRLLRARRRRRGAPS